MTGEIVTALALAAAAVGAGAGLRMVRADPRTAAVRSRAEAAAFHSWPGLVVAAVVCLLALPVATGALFADRGLSGTVAWIVACVLGVFGATRSHDRVDLVVLAVSALGITGAHAQFLFLTPSRDYDLDLYYLPMLAAFWGPAVAAAVWLGVDGSHLPRLLPAAFVGLLVLALVVDPGPTDVPLDVRLAVATLVAPLLGAAAVLAPRGATVGGLVALGGAAVVEAAAGAWLPGLVGAGDAERVLIPLLGLGGVALILTHLADGEGTRRS